MVIPVRDRPGELARLLDGAARGPGDRATCRSSWSTTAPAVPVRGSRRAAGCSGTPAPAARRRRATPGCGRRRTPFVAFLDSDCVPHARLARAAAPAPRRPAAGRWWRRGSSPWPGGTRGWLARVRGRGQRAGHGPGPGAGPAAVGGVLRAERRAAGPPGGARRRLRRDDAGRRGRRPGLAAGRRRLAGALRAGGAGGPRAPRARRRTGCGGGPSTAPVPRCWPPGTAARSRRWCSRRSRPLAWALAIGGGRRGACRGGRRARASPSVRLARRLARPGEPPPRGVRRGARAPRAGRRRADAGPRGHPAPLAARAGRGRAVSRRARRGSLAVARRRRRRSPGGRSGGRVGPVRFALARRLEDLAYGAGLWGGALRAGDLRALLPARPPAV